MKGRFPRNKFWCGGCDCYLVAPGEKCPECGRREYKRDAVRLTTNAILSEAEREFGEG